MKREYSFVIVFTLVFFFTACEDLGNNKIHTVTTQDIIDIQTLESGIANVSVQPLNVNKLDGNYEISIRFNESVRNFTMPDALVLCGIEDAEPLQKNINDQLLYSGVSKSDKLKKLYLNSINNKKSERIIQDVSIGCDVSFTRPGEYDSNCRARCSDTSILGGKTWFCVCFYNCRVEIEFFK